MESAGRTEAEEQLWVLHGLDDAQREEYGEREGEKGKVGVLGTGLQTPCCWSACWRLELMLVLPNQAQAQEMLRY